MKKPRAAVRQVSSSLADILFEGGSTAIFLVILASAVEALSRYLA